MPLNFDGKSNGSARPATVPCPVCTIPLTLGLLEITEDDGQKVTLFTFDCPTGHYYGTLRETEVRELAVREVIRRLKG